MNELLLGSVSRERLERWISYSYSCACNHGFHDTELSRKYFLMLVLSELGEIVEADRKGKHSKVDTFYKTIFSRCSSLSVDNSLFMSCFNKYIKDGIEDELADVCIRLFDYCGAFGIELSDVHFDEELCASWNELFGEQSLCENCFELCCLLCDIDEGDEGHNIGCVLSFIFCMCRHMSIDLERHIELKMRYNRLREPLHGKKY